MNTRNLAQLIHYPAAKHAFDHVRGSGPVSVASIRHYLKEQAEGVTEENADAVTADAIRRLTVFGLIAPCEGGDAYDAVP